MSSLELMDLPDEILLKILKSLESYNPWIEQVYIELKDLFRWSHVNKRMREISQIESMWHKFRHYKNVIPAPLLEMILDKGCRDLELGHFGRSTIKGSLTLTKPSKLKYLKLFFSKDYLGEVEKILASCHSLEKLSLSVLNITRNMANSICQQNWKTLTVLSFNTDDDHESISSEDFKNIIENCTELKEASFRRLYLSTASIDFLCKKLTPKIEKLCLSDVGKVFPKTGIRDEHVKSLVSRCYKLRELDLSVGWRLSPKRFITDKTIDYIIRFLKKSLEKLDLSPCDRCINSSKLLELRSMPHLKVLKYDSYDRNCIDLKRQKLKLFMPKLMKDKTYLNIANWNYED